MTKVHGTGTYDFRRHRVAEYPVAAEPKAVEWSQKSGGALPSTLTVSEIQRDRLTKIAEENWSKKKKEKAFDAEVVEKIYESELLVKEGQGHKPVPLQRVMILEVSQYLENYLWPHFDPLTATFQHVMSIILMVNEKVFLYSSLLLYYYYFQTYITFHSWNLFLPCSSAKMSPLGFASMRGKMPSKGFLRGFFA